MLIDRGSPFVKCNVLHCSQKPRETSPKKWRLLRADMQFLHSYINKQSKQNTHLKTNVQTHVVTFGSTAPWQVYVTLKSSETGLWPPFHG